MSEVYTHHTHRPENNFLLPGSSLTLAIDIEIEGTRRGFEVQDRQPDSGGGPQGELVLGSDSGKKPGAGG